MLEERHKAELSSISQSGECDDYAVLDECPEAVSLNAKWSRVWDAYERCR